MVLIPLKLDRVFDVQRRANRARTWTEFGFEAEGKKMYEAAVVGHPPIPIGQPLIAAVHRHTGWKQIYGWKNLTTWDIEVEPGKSVFVGLIAIGLAFLIASVPLWALNYPLMTAGQRTLTGVILLVTALSVAIRILRQRRQIAALSRLQSLPVADAG